MVSPTQTAITRVEIIKRLMNDCGATHRMATACYEAFVRMIGDSLADNRRVCLGRVCSLVPKETPPRKFRLNQVMEDGGSYRKTNKTFYVDKRVRYKVKIHKEFVRKRSLNLI